MLEQLHYLIREFEAAVVAAVESVSLAFVEVQDEALLPVFRNITAIEDCLYQLFAKCSFL